MTIEQKATAFDLLTLALTNRWFDGRWSCFCSFLVNQPYHAAREECVPDLLAWAGRVVAEKKRQGKIWGNEVMAEEKSRYASGGFSPRFVVTRTDGKPCRESARYMVLDGSGADRHAWLALKVYAASVKSENPELAADLEKMLGIAPGGGTITGGDWPANLAQHADAK